MKPEIILPEEAYKTATDALVRSRIDSHKFLQGLLERDNEEAIYAMNEIKQAAEDGYNSTYVNVSLKMLGILDGIGYTVDRENGKVSWSKQNNQH